VSGANPDQDLVERIAHWDARFGISGDMALGSVLAAGASLEAVNQALGCLGIPGLRAETWTAQRGAIACCRVAIRWEGDAGPPPDHPSRGPTSPPQPEAGHGHGHGHGQHGPEGRGAEGHRSAPHAHGAHRTLADVRRLLAPLPAPVREPALAVFTRLAEAEAAVHGVTADTVHFHEVGAEDALGDVVGTCAALQDLGVGRLTVSALPAGGGTVRAAHGLLPVPAPAVARLLVGFAVIPGPVEAELVTPTGAALAAALARPSPGWPAMRVAGQGWGGGTRDFPGHPNACRFVWGEAGPDAGSPWRRERLVELETHVDDQSPAGLGHLFERLFQAGALDVALSPLGMKKQRPGVRVWALVPADRVDAAARCVFRESTAIGLRLREVERWSLPRRSVPVQTRYGEVRVKLATLEGTVVNASPEFEDCRRLSLEAGVPLKAVVAAALAAAPWPGGASP
jgi:uncharacterized protein (TIGR00299 family) protein